MQDGSDALFGLLAGIMPYVGYAVILIAIGFFLLMLRGITRDAKRRSVRHREIQDRHLRR
jgi:hypothetical protein